MSLEARDDLSVMLHQRLSREIAEFGLRWKRVTPAEVLLIGQTFALDFGADRDGVDVSYLERTAAGQLAAYTLRFVEKERFTAADRVLFGSPDSLLDRRKASLDGLLSGLSNHCRDILSGDKSWLDRDAWRTVRPSDPVIAALAGELAPGG